LQGKKILEDLYHRKKWEGKAHEHGRAADAKMPRTKINIQRREKRRTYQVIHEIGNPTSALSRSRAARGQRRYKEKKGGRGCAGDDEVGSGGPILPSVTSY
jgi:hypothetical protein